jgi:hypothetical protein
VRGAGFEGLQPADRRSELVRDGDVRRIGVEGVRFAFTSRAGRSGAKHSIVANGFGLKVDRIVRVKLLGDREARPDKVASVGFVPPATEGLIRSSTDAVAFALSTALSATVVPLDDSTVPLFSGFDGCRRSSRAASGTVRRVRDRVAIGDRFAFVTDGVCMRKRIVRRARWYG